VACFPESHRRQLSGDVDCRIELENGRLKKLAAERDLDIAILKQVAAKQW
jgi:hypothetical protein